MNVYVRSLTSIYKPVLFVGFSTLTEGVATLRNVFPNFHSARKESILLPLSPSLLSSRRATDARIDSLCLCLRLFREVEHTFRALVYFGDMLRNEICVRSRDIKHRVTAKVRWDASRMLSHSLAIIAENSELRGQSRVR